MGKPRAALVVYRRRRGRIEFLLVSAASSRHKLTLPGGKLDRYESPMQAAVRETAEEAGIITHAPQPLGDYPHTKQGGRVHPTDTFLARFAGSLNKSEDRLRRWVGVDDLNGLELELRPEIRRQLLAAHRELCRERAAA